MSSRESEQLSRDGGPIINTGAARGNEVHPSSAELHPTPKAVKYALFLIVPILLIGGSIIGLALTGTINIPGLTPAKHKQTSKQINKDASKPPPVTPTPKKDPKPGPTPTKPASAMTIDTEKGAAELADLWSEVDDPKTTLVPILKDWKDDDIAHVLLKMDSDKAAAILFALPTDRASKISKLLEKDSSIVKPETES